MCFCWMGFPDEHIVYGTYATHLHKEQIMSTAYRWASERLLTDGQPCLVFPKWVIFFCSTNVNIRMHYRQKISEDVSFTLFSNLCKTNSQCVYLHLEHIYLFEIEMIIAWMVSFLSCSHVYCWLTQSFRESPHWIWSQN